MRKHLLYLVYTSFILLVIATSAMAQTAPPVPEVLYYRFDGTGTQVPNLSQNPPVGTAMADIMGGVTQGSSGLCGGALVGSGVASSTDYLNTHWSPNLGNSSWSISFWSSNITPSSTLFYIFGDAGTASFRCFTNGVAGANNWILRGAGLTDILVSGAATVAPHMTTFVYDNTVNNVKAYLDGVLVNTVAQGAPNLTGSGPFKVMGYATNVGSPAGGLMDEYRLYSHALSQAEVLALYERYTYATITVNECGTSYTSPSTNHTWTTAGTYSDTLTGANEYCGDSVLTINLSFTTPVTPSVSITASPGTTVCSGASVTFTATATNGGTPTYQWYRNGILQPGNTNTYTASGFTPGTTVYAVMTSTLPCVSSTTVNSNTITMTVLPTVTPDVTIAANPGPSICPAQSVTFTATPVDAGTPAYQWFKNNVLQPSTTNTFTDNTLNNGDAIKCVITPVGVCPSTPTDTSNIITMTVNPNVTPSVSIAANPGISICDGVPVTFTATPVNGGAPTYQWFRDNVLQAATGNTYTDNTLTNGSVITAVLTATGICTTTPTATSNAIAMTVILNVTPSVSIAANPGISVCDGASVTFTATPVNGGTPTYQWFKDNVLQAATGNTYTDNTLTNGNVITAVLTASGICTTTPTASSNAITMTVIPNVTPDVTVAVSPGTTICSDATATFIATPTNGGMTPGYQWFKNNILQPATGTTYIDNSINNGDIIKGVLTSSEQCVAVPTDTSTTTMTVTAPTGSLAGVSGTTEADIDDVSLPTQFHYTDCDLIASITPSGVTPVSGTVSASVTIDNTVNNYNGAFYVQRHFDVEPANNPSTATGTITLYALQSEFDAYNAAAPLYPQLPTGGVDNGNVKITQFHGTGTAPGNYTGTAELIIPAVSWDAANNWWVMTFPVVGFSGFYIHTAWTANPLNIDLTSITAQSEGNSNRVDWATATETKGSVYTIQRSIDGKSFIDLGAVIAKGVASTYIYRDTKPVNGVNYYRIKLDEQGKESSYSKVVTAVHKADNSEIVTVYPNPVTDLLQINYNGVEGQLELRDITGKLLIKQGLTRTLDMTGLASGTYMLQVNTKDGMKLSKMVTKQ